MQRRKWRLIRKLTKCELTADCSRANRQERCRWLNVISCIDMSPINTFLPRAYNTRPAGRWPSEKAVGSLTLDFDQRHRRRIRLTDDLGQDLLLDLPSTVAMADGDGLQLDDGRWLRIQAATELVVEVRHKDPSQLVRL